MLSLLIFMSAAWVRGIEGAQWQKHFSPTQRISVRHSAVPGAIEAARPHTPHQEVHHPAWLPLCKHVYLDVGSNIGVQARKFFEPAKYPDAPILSAFDEFFGTAEQRTKPGRKTGICVLGFEPNAMHQTRLQKLAQAYLARGWYVHFYHAAAWYRDGQKRFNIAPTSPWNGTYLGAHLALTQFLMNSGRDGFAPNTTNRTTSVIARQVVRTLDLAKLIMTVLPPGSVEFMKMDIEGSEWETLQHMLQKHTLCHKWIKHGVIETHSWGETKHWQGPRDFATIAERLSSLHCEPAPHTQLLYLDDETYMEDVDSDFWH